VTGGRCNVYAYHEGMTSLVAVVAAGDYPNWSQTRQHHTSSVSVDGQSLAFMSQEPLTGYDNRDAASGERDEEVFLYRAGTDTVVCASCNPTGSRPYGRPYGQIQEEGGGISGGSGSFEDQQWIAAIVPGWTAYRHLTSLHQPRYLSGDGRLFFNTTDALAPQDVNNTSDVYQFESTGQGACSATAPSFHAASGGCLDLISSGEGSEESAFLDASESGSDVFFLTSAPLSAQDVDTSYDVYDAHQCTTSAPCPPAPVTQPPPCAAGDSCKPAPTPQPPIFGAPTSSTFHGGGNPAPGAGPSKGSPTRAQQLARALRSCHAIRRRSRRRTCEAQAHRRFGPIHHSHRAGHTRK
jgi:hypothetical protein